MVFNLKQKFVLRDVYYWKISVMQKEILGVERVDKCTFGFADEHFVLG
jgi:hypothetical protein